MVTMTFNQMSKSPVSGDVYTDKCEDIHKTLTFILLLGKTTTLFLTYYFNV